MRNNNPILHGDGGPRMLTSDLYAVADVLVLMVVR